LNGGRFLSHGKGPLKHVQPVFDVQERPIHLLTGRRYSHAKSRCPSGGKAASGAARNASTTGGVASGEAGGRETTPGLPHEEGEVVLV